MTMACLGRVGILTTIFEVYQTLLGVPMPLGIHIGALMTQTCLM